MPQADLELVRLAYDVAWPQRSIEAFCDRFADDYTWEQRSEWPGRAVYGRDELTELWADLDDTYSDFRLVPIDFTEAGEYVFVRVKTRGRMRGSDAQIEGTVYHVWHLRDGLALETRVYTHEAEARQAAGLDAVA